MPKNKWNAISFGAGKQKSKTTKLVLELPEWVLERHIYVFAGIELYAYKPYGEDKIYIKTERCNFCGKCCENLREPGPFELDENKTCIHLEQVGKDKQCKLGTHRPWACSWYDPHLTKSPDAEEVCCIKYDIKDIK